MKKMQILGTGCAKCQQLTANAESAAKQLGIPFEIVKVVDGVVKSQGRLLSSDQIKPLLA